MREKKGSMSINKLIAILLIIILVVVLVLAQKILPQMVEKVGGKFNEALIFLHIKDGPSTDGCEEMPVLDYGIEATDFFKDLGVSEQVQQETSLVACTSKGCILEMSSEGTYRLKQGRFAELVINGEEENEEDWLAVDEYLFESPNEVKKEWEIYNHVVDVVESEVGEAEFSQMYLKATTKQFELFGDRLFEFRDVYFVWENGVWRMYVGKVLQGSTTDDSEAIDKFYGLVEGVNDNPVFWRISIPKTSTGTYIGSTDHGESIGLLVGGDGELDSDAEKEKLLQEFKNSKQKLLEEATLSSGDVDRMKAALSGGSIVAGGKDYILEFSVNGRSPLITLKSSDGDNAWLVYDNQAGVHGEIKVWKPSLKEYDYVRLRTYPLSLTFDSPIKAPEDNEEDYSNPIKTSEIADPTGLPDSAFTISNFGPDQKFYRLPKENFDEAYKLSKIKEFINSRCV